MLTLPIKYARIQRCAQTDASAQLSPWQAQVYRLVSWWDVERFAAERFYALARLLDMMIVSYCKKEPAQVLSQRQRNLVASDVGLTETECLKLSLQHSADAAAEFRKELLKRSISYTAGQISSKLDDLSDSIRREMKRTLFMYVPRERARWYQEPLKDWEAVTARWPKTLHDIEEAAKCFACDRFDGAVVHMMLVAEYGALEIGKLLELNDPKLGWPRVSKELKRITSDAFPKLSALEQKHFPLLEQISPLMLAMQNAWRHKVSHADNRLVLLSGEFQPFVAEEIIFATRAFMRRLATDLPTT